MVSKRDEAVAVKNKGNAAFAKKDWNDAIDFYSQAIELDPTDPAFYSNRAQVHSFIRQEHPELRVYLADENSSRL